MPSHFHAMQCIPHNNLHQLKSFTQGTPLCEALLQLCLTIMKAFKTGYTAKGLTKALNCIK